MNIGLVQRNIDKVGGGPRWTYEVVSHLRARGHNVHLFIDNVAAPNMFPKSYQNLLMAKNIAKQTKKIKDLDCILLCSDMEFSSVFKGDAPLIGILHEDAFLKRLHVNGWRQLLQMPVRRMGYLNFDALDAVVVNSKFTANNVKEIFPETHVAYPGVNHDQFYPDGSPDDGYLIYVARFSPGGKNHALAIDVANVLHTKLILAGSIASEDYLNQLPNVPEVEFHLNITDDELVKLYQKSSIYLHPSIREAFGLTVVEAMACGKPAVVHKMGGGAREIAEGYGLVAESVDEWCEAVQSLLSSCKMRKRVGEQCRQRALDFTWEGTAKDLEKVILGLV